MLNMKLISTAGMCLFLISISLAEAVDYKNEILKNIPAHTFHPIPAALETGEIKEDINNLEIADEGQDDTDIKTLVLEFINDPLRTHIKKIDLKDNNITDSGAIDIATLISFAENLEILDISNNPIELIGLQTILLKIKQHSKSPALFCSQLRDENQLRAMFKDLKIQTLEGGIFKIKFECPND